MVGAKIMNGLLQDLEREIEEYHSNNAYDMGYIKGLNRCEKVAYKNYNDLEKMLKVLEKEANKIYQRKGDYWDGYYDGLHWVEWWSNERNVK